MVKIKMEKDYFDRNGYSYLVDHFYAFYSELVALKRQFSAQLESGAEAGIANDDQNLSENAKSVSRQLIGVLELHHIDAQRTGGSHSFEINREAQYLMAALADEFMLRFEWPGREVWGSCLIEDALFKTRISGDLFFDRLDELLRSRDVARLDLALVYLMILAVGFEGRYRGSDCRERMESYKRALYRFRFDRDADIFNPTRHIAPQAYDSTIRNIMPQYVANIRPAVVTMVCTFIGVLIVSQILWMWKAGVLIDQLRLTVAAPGFF